MSDLLRESKSQFSNPLKIKKDSYGLITIQNVTLKRFKNFIEKGPDELIEIHKKGMYNREMRATYENETSSRSIMVSTFRIDKRNKLTKKITCGKLTFCDLAGSE